MCDEQIEKAFKQIDYRPRIDSQIKIVNSWIEDESKQCDRYAIRLKDIIKRITNTEQNYINEMKKIQEYLNLKQVHINDRSQGYGKNKASGKSISNIIENDEQFTLLFYSKLNAIQFEIIEERDSIEKKIQKQVYSTSEDLIKFFESTKNAMKIIIETGPVLNMNEFRDQLRDEINFFKQKYNGKKNDGKMNQEVVESIKQYNSKMQSLHQNCDDTFKMVCQNYASYRIVKQDLHIQLLDSFMGTYLPEKAVKDSQILRKNVEKEVETDILVNLLAIGKAKKWSGNPNIKKPNLEKLVSVGQVQSESKGLKDKGSGSDFTAVKLDDKNSGDSKYKLFNDRIRYRSTQNNNLYSELEKLSCSGKFVPEYIDWLDNFGYIPRYYNFNKILEVETMDLGTKFDNIGKLLIVLAYDWRKNTHENYNANYDDISNFENLLTKKFDHKYDRQFVKQFSEILKDIDFYLYPIFNQQSSAKKQNCDEIDQLGLVKNNEESEKKSPGNKDRQSFQTNLKDIDIGTIFDSVDGSNQNFLSPDKKREAGLGIFEDKLFDGEGLTPEQLKIQNLKPKKLERNFVKEVLFQFLYVYNDKSRLTQELLEAYLMIIQFFITGLVWKQSFVDIATFDEKFKNLSKIDDTFHNQKAIIDISKKLVGVINDILMGRIDQENSDFIHNYKLLLLKLLLKKDDLYELNQQQQNFANKNQNHQDSQRRTTMKDSKFNLESNEKIKQMFEYDFKSKQNLDHFGISYHVMLKVVFNSFGDNLFDGDNAIEFHQYTILLNEIFGVDVISNYYLFNRWLWFRKFKLSFVKANTTILLATTFGKENPVPNNNSNSKRDSRRLSRRDSRTGSCRDTPKIDIVSEIQNLNKMTSHMKFVIEKIVGGKLFDDEKFRGSSGPDFQAVRHAITAQPMLDMLSIFNKKSKEFFDEYYLTAFLYMFSQYYKPQFDFLQISPIYKKILDLIGKLGLDSWNEINQNQYNKDVISNEINTTNLSSFEHIASELDKFEIFIKMIIDCLQLFQTKLQPIILAFIKNVNSVTNQNEHLSEFCIREQCLQNYYYGILSEFKAGMLNAQANLDTNFIRTIPPLMTHIRTQDKYSTSLDVYLEPQLKTITPMLKSWIDIFNKESEITMNNIMSNETWEFIDHDERYAHTVGVVDFVSNLYRYIDIFKKLLECSHLKAEMEKDLVGAVFEQILKFIKETCNSLAWISIHEIEFQDQTKENLNKDCQRGSLELLDEKIMRDSTMSILQVCARVGNLKFLKNECLALNSSTWEWKFNELLSVQQIDQIAKFIDQEIDGLVPKLSSHVYNSLTKRIILDSLYCGLKKDDQFICEDLCLRTVFEEIDKIHVVLEGQLDPEQVSSIKKTHILFFMNGFGKKLAEMIKYKKFNSQYWKKFFMDDLLFLNKKIFQDYNIMISQNVNYKLIEKMIASLKPNDNKKFIVVNNIKIQM